MLISTTAFVLQTIRGNIVRPSVNAVCPVNMDDVPTNLTCASVRPIGGLQETVVSTKVLVSTAPLKEGLARMVLTRASVNQDIWVHNAPKRLVMDVFMDGVIWPLSASHVAVMLAGPTKFMSLDLIPCTDPVR